MPVAAVVGRPIAHSLSPSLHRAAYAALQLPDWSYTAVDSDEAGFPALLAGSYAGLSVTMPCKRAALAHAGTASELARAIGAANTVVRRPEGWFADNTDVAGIVGALGEAGVDTGRGAVVLGAGGTAQAVLAALRTLGEPRPLVLVRATTRTEALLASAERLGVQPRLRVGPDDPALYAAPLVISTLPTGAADPLARAAAWCRPESGPGVLLDVCYDPWPTALARSAQAAGRTVISGLSMLLHQAFDQVELMTGRPAPQTAMRTALQTALRQRADRR